MDNIPISVLYVDDETDLLHIGKIFLERNKTITVDTAPSAAVALEKLTSTSYDAVISDYQMPGMDGIELLQEVRRQFHDIPFILFTGRGREEVVIQAINHGADFYLQKGGDPRSQFVELEHKVKQAVSRRQAEHALRESERTSRVLLDANADAVALISGDLTILATNDAFSRRIELTSDRTVGRNLQDFTAPDLEKKQKARIAEVIETKTPLRFEDQRDGLFLENRFYPIFDEQGEVFRLAIYSRDITDRKRAEDELLAAYEQLSASEESLKNNYQDLLTSENALRESETRYRSLFENASDAILLLKDGLGIDCNSATLTMFACSREQIIGRTPFDLSPPEQPGGISSDIGSRALMKSAYDGQPQSFEWVHKTFDGRLFTADISLNKVILSGVPHMLAFIRDVTSRKMTEEALQKEQAFTRLLLDTSPGFFVAIGADGKTIMMNQILLDTLEFSADEVKGKDYLSTFVPASDQEMLSKVFREIVYDDSVTLNTNRIVSRSGREYLVEWHGRQVKGTKGEMDFFVGVGIDVTRHKDAEETLRKSEGRYRSLVETTGTGYVVLDMNGRVLDANDEYLRLTGRSSMDEISGHPVTEWTAPYDLERNAEEVSRCVRDGFVRGLEIDYIHPDGTIQPLEVNASVVRSESGDSILTLCRDISTRKRG